MSDIVITAKNNIWACLLKLLDVIVKFVQPLVFVGLPFIAGCAGRKISIYQFYFPKIQLNHPSFIITYLVPGTALDFVRMNFCENRYTAVSFFLCTKPVIMIP